MSAYPSKLLRDIYRIPIIGDVVIYVLYFISLLSPIGLWILGYKRIKVGTSVIWTPRNKSDLISDAINLLKNIDIDMYIKFSEKQTLFIYCSKNENITNLFGYIFGLQETYVKFGKEGIACFIVQSLLVSEASPSKNQFKSKLSTREPLKVAPRKTMEWMRQHSFDLRLINSYSKVVEKWEKRYVA